jgi:glycosyltransferase involved in cell wall biosynthesis
VVSISYAQRLPLPQAYWVGNVYHGLPLNLYKQGKGEGGYMTFIGRISPEKGLDRAIEIAIQSGKKLKIAAKVANEDKLYYETSIRHLLNHPLIEFLGEVGEAGKSELLSNAECLLFPINWPEPFGMVMIEAMACGTPVLAFGHGSVPEVLKDGVTGHIVNSTSEALEKLTSTTELSRTMVRAHFESSFTAERMAQDYVAIYEKQIKARRTFTLQPDDIHSVTDADGARRYKEDPALSEDRI